MGILDTLLDGGNRQVVRQLAKSVGIDEQDVNQVLNLVTPAISKGIKQNLEQSEGASGLLKSVSSGQFQHYLEQPEAIAQSNAIEEGNTVLSEALGSKDVSRQLANQVAEKTNVDSSLIKQLLPMAATIVMGAVTKKVVTTRQLQPGATSDSGLSGILMSMLDADDDGDVTDDLLNLAKKLF